MVELLHSVLAVLSGSLVGFTLGLIGGGGSIMATPLLLYIVGLQPHEAIGTGALAVSVNAFANFGSYARSGNVRWGCAALFAAVGVIGAAIGSTLGKVFDGRRLLFLFGILMVAVAITMLRRGRLAMRSPVPRALHGARPTFNPLLVSIAALLVGALSGFFGIGGGFLIVPGLLFSSGMPMIDAVGSSLLSVRSFGMTTAVNYAVSGLIDWPIAAEYIFGGVLGGLLGIRLAKTLALRKAVLNQVFAGFVFVVAAYMLYRNAAAVSLS